MAEHNDRTFFKLLIKDLNKELADSPANKDQKKQVEKLIKLENLFRKSIWKYPAQAKEVYKKFVVMVVFERKNLLSAKPYFREKSVTFNKYIKQHIKTANVTKIKRFQINFSFIDFIKNNWMGNLPPECEILFQQIKQARSELILHNTPLAINRAKQFHQKVPESHLALEDMVAYAVGALAIGIDKFVGPYTKVFRSVVIGYITRDLMDYYSTTMIYLYPSDEVLLYRANSIKTRQGITDIVDLAAAVNASFEKDRKEGKNTIKTKITSSELALLMGAASVLSENQESEEEGKTSSLFDVYSAKENDAGMEERIASRQATVLMLKCLKDLKMVEKKIINLKGVK